MSKRAIMMVTFNRIELTKKTIESLYNTTKDFELVIIDNKSEDGTIEYLNELKSKHNNVHVIFNKDNKGIAYGRNQALKLAVSLGAEWLSTIDNDVILPNNWLDDCIEILKLCKSYGSIGVSFEDVNYQEVELNGCKFQNKPRGNLGTACTVFSVKLHKMLGFFTTEYEKYGEEDSDWGFRIRSAQMKLGYLLEKGIHLGEGDNDTGDYREFKDECRRKNLKKFHENCSLYAQGKKTLYISFKEIND